MKKLLFIGIFTAFALSAELKIAAAANMNYALEELKSEFLKTHPNDEMQIITAASGKLAAQIKNGAEYDVFISADEKFPKILKDEGFSVNEPKIYAKGVLAMISVRGISLKKGLEALKDEKIKSIVIANTKTAPYGAASLELLENSSLYESLKDKIIESGSISEALSQTLSAADIGFSALSLLKAPKMSHLKENEHYIKISSSLHAPINQAMIVLKSSKNQSLAIEFFNFILSPQGKEILAKYGYEF